MWQNSWADWTFARLFTSSLLGQFACWTDSTSSVLPLLAPDLLPIFAAEDCNTGSTCNCVWDRFVCLSVCSGASYSLALWTTFNAECLTVGRQSKTLIICPLFLPTFCALYSSIEGFFEPGSTCPCWWFFWFMLFLLPQQFACVLNIIIAPVKSSAISAQMIAPLKLYVASLHHALKTHTVICMFLCLFQALSDTAGPNMTLLCLIFLSYSYVFNGAFNFKFIFVNWLSYCFWKAEPSRFKFLSSRSMTSTQARPTCTPGAW